MKVGVAVRAFSAVEQGVLSLTNFMVLILVSRYGNAESIAQFSLMFGLYFLNTRLHFALIAMPLSIQTGKLNHDFRALTNKYIGYSFILALISIVLTLPLLWVVDALWLHLTVDLDVFLCIGIIIGVLPLIETVRRIFISKNIKYALAYSVFNGVILLSSIYYIAAVRGLSGAFVFLGYAPVLFIAVAYLLKINKTLNLFRSDFVCHCKHEYSLVFHSLLQWLNGYTPIYVAAALLNANSVAFIVLLKNIFGPLNIILLSLESYMPRLFKLHHDSLTYEKFRRSAYKEILVFLTLVSVTCAPLLVYKVEVFGFLYGLDKYITGAGYMFYIYFLIYVFSFVSRIFSIGLRVRSRGQQIAFGTGLGSLLLFVSIIPLVKLLEDPGLLYAMLLSEIVIAFYYKRIFDEKNI